MICPSDMPIIARDSEHVVPANWKPNPKMLYTHATNCGWNHQGVKDLILTHFKRTSTKDLTFHEFNKTLDLLETLPPNTVTAEHDKNTVELFE
jgi:hypothetical protein